MVDFLAANKFQKVTGGIPIYICKKIKRLACHLVKILPLDFSLQVKLSYS